MPTKHFSAWRLNKGEQASVDSDLATWEAALPLDLSEEEKTTLREDERKRLIRLVQQKKHDASLQKQCAAGAKTKSNANAKGAEKAAAKHVSDASSPGDGCGSNQEYYSQARLGSYLESFELRPEGDAAHTHCRHGARHDWHPGRLVFLVIHIFNLCAGSLIEDPFDLQKAKVALESHGSYISSCNLYWLDMWKNPAPGVPLARERIAALANFYYPEDRNNNFFHKLLEVQVDVGALTDKPHGLVVISPLEIIHAIVLKAAQELGRDGVTAYCKDSWRQALLLGVLSGRLFHFIVICYCC